MFDVAQADIPMFNIDSADQQDKVVTLSLREDFIRTVTWALRNCPPTQHSTVAGVLSSQLFKVAQFLNGELPIEELVDRNKRGLVEVVISEDGDEIEHRKNVAQTMTHHN
jgi:hypothetical protein